MCKRETTMYVRRYTGSWVELGIYIGFAAFGLLLALLHGNAPQTSVRPLIMLIATGLIGYFGFVAIRHFWRNYDYTYVDVPRPQPTPYVPTGTAADKEMALNHLKVARNVFELFYADNYAIGATGYLERITDHLNKARALDRDTSITVDDPKYGEITYTLDTLYAEVLYSESQYHFLHAEDEMDKTDRNVNRAIHAAFAKALPAIEKALRYRSDFWLYHAHHAKVLWNMGQPDAARAPIMRAYQMRPNDPDVLEMYTHLCGS